MTDGLLALFAPPEDPAVDDVANALLELDPDGSGWAAVIRHTYDMIYNGQETGRYHWDQLMKTEKTHFGTVFEINAQRKFKFDGLDEDPTDYRIRGHLVDAKWSQTDGRWMLPRKSRTISRWSQLAVTTNLYGLWGWFGCALSTAARARIGIRRAR